MDSTIHNFYDLSKAKGVKIVHLNIRSLFKKIDQLRLILIDSNIDIITLSETWLHQNIDSQLINIQGYSVNRLDRELKYTHKKRGGRLVAYIKNSIEVNTYNSESISSNDIEVQWLRVKRHMSKDILLANIYRPLSGNLTQALSLLEKSIVSLASMNDKVLLLGDFNVDYKNQKKGQVS